MADKKRSRIDKLIKGIIIGGAIGSVVGITLAPKSGKETRRDIQKTANSFFSRSKKEVVKIEKSIPQKQPKKKGALGTLLGGIRTLFFGKKKS